MDTYIEKQVRILAQTYGPEVVWKNVLLLAETRYKNLADEGQTEVAKVRVSPWGAPESCNMQSR